MALHDYIKKLCSDYQDPGRLIFKAYRYMNEDDSITHIRIDPHAVTNLGKQLTPRYSRVFFYPPENQSFISIDSARQYLLLRNKDNIVCRLTGAMLTEYIDKSINTGENEYARKYLTDEELVSLMFYSFTARPALLKWIVNNQLPYCTYRSYSNGDAYAYEIRMTNLMNTVIPKLFLISA
ncbi:hypothetical protein [Bergeriella denitrificans]|uniref:Uncharacterized protein n=1 Tax=Bergeriella denitrificans TaxID=494 RepID=A0A378UHU7_BERDE|nr:hypothetical protein [Bergeriella denitrificans]STZ76954.1 Uncharacterised protein [Bergeriella denitrificans]